MSVKIFCNINAGQEKQNIYLVGEDGSLRHLDAVAPDDVGHTVVRFALENKAEDVLLGGSSEAYLERFVDDIYTINTLMYANNNIKVHILGE